jgi:HPr kinase/phosphorylase
MPTVASLFEDNRKSLHLAWLAGHAGGTRAFRPNEGIEVDAADLVGHLNLIHATRLHVLGALELAYINGLEGGRRAHDNLAAEFTARKPLGLIVAEGLVVPPSLLKAAEFAGIPVFTSPAAAARVIDMLRTYLNRVLAPHCTMHGVFMDVLGMGVLIAGESGVGKSELGLELISRGHGLVADDVVEFARISPDSIEGHCPALLSNLLEVRGLGLLDIKAIFGETSVRRKMKLRLIVELRRSSATDSMDRLPLAGTSDTVLGIAVHKVVIPVVAGRNLAVLLEAAVRNTILKLRGIDTLGEFQARQQQAMKDAPGT